MVTVKKVVSNVLPRLLKSGGVAAAVGAVLVLGTSGVAAASINAPAAPSSHVGTVRIEQPAYRQFLGHVSQTQLFEASTPAAGNYAVEYDITGTAFFDTYINNTELGYVGGGSGTYFTKSVALSAGGQLVEAAGPEGSGQADVYLVSTS